MLLVLGLVNIVSEQGIDWDRVLTGINWTFVSCKVHPLYYIQLHFGLPLRRDSHDEGMQIIEDDGRELKGSLEVMLLSVDVLAPSSKGRGVVGGREGE